MIKHLEGMGEEDGTFLFYGLTSFKQNRRRSRILLSQINFVADDPIDYACTYRRRYEAPIFRFY